MKQIFSGLKHIHSLEIMHRDIKLENILIKDGNNLLIADFGLAAKKSQKFEYKKYGTPGYIAPEVLNLKVYNEKLDVFSAGIVAYILLTS
jgi:calcium-dependent protein kinase